MTTADIFEQMLCIQFKDEFEKRRSLAQLARTCRRFSRYALPALWKHLPSLRPLLSLLAPLRPTRIDANGDETPRWQHSLGHAPSERDLGYTWAFDGPIAPEGDLPLRFTQYASFVRVLNIHRFPQFNPSVFTHLEDAGLHGPLLPALTNLDCERTPLSAIAAKWVVGPSLLSFSITPHIDPLMYMPFPPSGYRPRESITDGPMLGLDTLVTRLQSSSPNIETLRVFDNVSHWALHSILAFTNLRIVDISVWHDCDTDVLRSLATLPHLHTLRLSVRAFVGESTPLPGGFAHLECLAISGNQEAIARAAEMIVPPGLCALWISGVFDYREVMRRTLYPLCNRYSSTLTEVHLECTNLYGFDLMEILDPLLPVSNLRVCMLSTEMGMVSFTDADLMVLAARWPALSVFSIMCGKGRALPTLQGIADFADACPNLTQISLEQIAWPLIPEAEEGEHVHRKNKLKLLTLRRGANVGNIVRTDPRAAALVVDRLFPALDVQSSKAMIEPTRPVTWAMFWEKVLNVTEEVQKTRRVIDNA
ncbi:uncharacterized protein B0H18DRAFT_1010523 [Fomitopsis serialis]|uniref:uncharacterized protein n=1 Tax=Fomitopsis serialis TaxID=139415 RepID=UPI0020073BB3|nr:uncharacterized protein B0H18DRAFT_1010523 [Neoantrodia serialis]KAH9924869.1 hypothetical protein B0H18DRAFT_1010523 [Neoantrodia serialis]